jgi:creatinine amidohydrolase
MRRVANVLLGVFAICAAGCEDRAPLAPAPAPRTPPPDAAKTARIHLEDMTWPEIRSAIDAGARSVIVPTAGTEQNGPHMVLGKHRHVVEFTSGEVARRRGKTLLAPTVVYTPEGSMSPPTGHMAFAGTVSLREETYAAVLTDIAASLRAHGFTRIYFLGDSGDSQATEARVASQLDAEWSANGTRVFALGDYYAVGNQRMSDALLADGETEATIGRHAGIRDTSELLQAHPAGVRTTLLAPNGGGESSTTGTVGDPTRATKERGAAFLELKINAALAQIQALERGAVR